MVTAPRISLVDARMLATLERAFARIAGDDARIDAGELQRALGLRSAYLARRVLAQFDLDGDGTIDRVEFLDGVRRLVLGSDRDKLRFAFGLHDHDGDGALARPDVHRMIAMSLAEADVDARASLAPDALVDALMRAADRNRDGRVSFDEFEAVVARHPELVRAMTRSEAIWIAPSGDLIARVDAPPARVERVRRLARYGQNRWQRFAFLGAWLAANVAVFAAAMLANRAPGGTDVAMQLGRACGACLNLDGALVLVPVMRRLLARLRASPLGRVVPVDDANAFHRLVGHALFGLAVVHSGAFLYCYVEGHPKGSLALLLLASRRGATGAALLAVFAVMWLAALGRIRRTHRFELFYFTHLLYVAWFAIALVHAPSFLPWVALPALGFGVERALRVGRRGRPTVALQAQALRSGVTRLDLVPPRGFVFRAGDYVFLRVPSIARHEWHPFTISSAPERDALTVHVRSLGNWTAALRRRVERDELAEGPVAPLVVQVDGPYGSPTGRLFRSRYAVFVGAGIGVTPFASVLESLVLRAQGDRPASLRKGHFFWLNRDQYAFEWFAAMLAQLELTDTAGLIDVHLYMTGGRADATSFGLELARDVAHAAGGRDVVTGLRAMTQMGHPDWDAVLGAIARQHAPATVDLYFCGPPGLGITLARVCARVGMTYREERF